jgi:hypothetical protein
MGFFSVKHIIFFLSIVFIFLYSSCLKDKGELYVSPSCDTTDTKYNNAIKDIISSTCATQNCHVNGGIAPGDFTLYSEVKMKVDDNGKLNDRVFVNTSSPMPPTYADKQLSDCEKLKLRRWLDNGAQNN